MEETKAIFKVNKVFIINGYASSGKDTFIKNCSVYCNVFNISTVDPIKAALKILGWDGEKTRESRRLIKDLRCFSEENFDGVCKYLEKEIWSKAGTTADAIFIHAREPYNIERYKKKFNAKTILVHRHNFIPNGVAGNSDVYEYKNYDYTIENITPAQLRYEAKMFIEKAVLMP